jgi:hypothetical protein
VITSPHPYLVPLLTPSVCQSSCHGYAL